MGKLKEFYFERIIADQLELEAVEKETAEIVNSLSSATPSERKQLISKIISIAREYGIIPSWLLYEILDLPGVQRALHKELDSASIKKRIETEKIHRKIYLFSLAYNNVSGRISTPQDTNKEEVISEVLEIEFSIHRTPKTIKKDIHNFGLLLRSHEISLNESDQKFTQKIEELLLKSYPKI